MKMYTTIRKGHKVINFLTSCATNIRQVWKSKKRTKCYTPGNVLRLPPPPPPQYQPWEPRRRLKVYEKRDQDYLPTKRDTVKGCLNCQPPDYRFCQGDISCTPSMLGESCYFGGVRRSSPRMCLFVDGRSCNLRPFRQQQICQPDKFESEIQCVQCDFFLLHVAIIDQLWQLGKFRQINQGNSRDGRWVEKSGVFQQDQQTWQLCGLSKASSFEDSMPGFPAMVFNSTTTFIPTLAQHNAFPQLRSVASKLWRHCPGLAFGS